MESKVKDELLLELLAEYDSLELPVELQAKVVLATKAALSRYFEKTVPKALAAPSTSKSGTVSMEQNFNLYSSLPKELRGKVIDDLVYARPYGRTTNLFTLRSKCSSLDNLRQVFPDDELIIAKMHAHQYIAMCKEGFHEEEDEDATLDCDVLAHEGNYFKYRVETLEFLSNFEHDDMSLSKVAELFEKEKALQYIKVWNLADNDTMTVLPFSKLTCDLNNLKELILDCVPIKTLEHLEHFPNLKLISCNFSALSSIRDVSFLTKLEQLILVECNFTEIPPAVKNLPSLKTLNLSQNKIMQIDNLDNATNLEILNLTQNRISEIKNLDQCVNLEILALGANPDIFKIQNLDKLQNLKNLCLEQTSVLRIENLSNLKSLRTLILHDTNVSKLENLDGVDKLENLFLTDCRNGPYTKLENLDNLTSLVQLSISPCADFTQIENLDNLVSLERLSITKHFIKNAANLERLQNLKYLDLSFGILENIDDIKVLTSLEGVNVNFNRIGKIGDLSDLKNLEKFTINEKDYLRSDYPSAEKYFAQLSKLKSDELTDEAMEFFNDDRRRLYAAPYVTDPGSRDMMSFLLDPIRFAEYAGVSDEDEDFDPEEYDDDSNEDSQPGIYLPQQAEEYWEHYVMADRRAYLQQHGLWPDPNADVVFDELMRSRDIRSSSRDSNLNIDEEEYYGDVYYDGDVISHENQEEPAGAAPVFHSDVAGARAATQLNDDAISRYFEQLQPFVERGQATRNRREESFTPSQDNEPSTRDDIPVVDLSFLTLDPFTTVQTGEMSSDDDDHS